MKQELRNKILKQRDSLDEHKRKEHEEHINEKLWEFINLKQLKTMHCYLPFRSEVNLLPVLEKAIHNNIKVICPQTLKDRKLRHLELLSINSIEEGLYGTPYPSGDKEYNGEYDLILVPGAAFDQKANRLGYGGGYYDTFLAQHPKALKAGVCFPFQIVEKVETEEHDIRMDVIFTNNAK